MIAFRLEKYLRVRFKGGGHFLECRKAKVINESSSQKSANQDNRFLR